MIRRISGIIVTVVSVAAMPVFAETSVRRDHVVVNFDGIDKEHAEAIAATVEAARGAAAKIGFDMPKTIVVQASARLAAGAGLFNDGDDRIFLSVRSTKDLRKPKESGVFLIYGMCHEVGHLAMYQTIRDHRWMTTAAAEGWAHYLGSRFVDAVYDSEGEKLWPDRYDYRADGLKRLKRQREAARPSPTVRGAGLWADFVELIGDKELVATFAAWGQARIDPADPAKTLAAALPDREGVRQWWTAASPVFIAKSPVSPFAARTAKHTDLTGEPKELAHDDGKSAGKRSIAGAGHAVAFEVPDNHSYLTAIQLFGARYGAAEAPEEKFTVYLLDEQNRRIAEFAFAYSRFNRGEPTWVDLEVTPTLTPKKFVICFDFQPTATKGVFVHHDAGSSGRSATGIPGREFQKVARGDWMIRVSVDRLKSKMK
jgi:hypothetical protein